tara:strand:- start:322 stop:480 length:159 start_codon:yes stop_codon:yes gene_type:complete
MYKIYNDEDILVAVSNNDIDYSIQQLLEENGYEIRESALDCYDSITLDTKIL